MQKDNVVVGLDIGTTKVEAIIAEVDEKNEIKIVGIGTTPSEGLRKGMVVNLEKTVNSIVRAIDEAELMAGIQVSSVYAGIAGDHVRGINSRGVIAVSRGDNEITKNDVVRVIDAAKAVALPTDRKVIHILPQEFCVDDQWGIKDPVGMSGVRLEAEVHIVTGAVTSAQNIYKSINRAGLGIIDLVLEPLAASFAVLTPDEEELGVVLIDLGGGTTDLAIFYEGSIRHTAILGLGGRNVTNDIAIGLRTPLDQAEEIKLKHGCALTSMVDAEERVIVPGVGGRKPREVSREVLAAIIEPRMEELFSLTHREIRKSDYADMLSAGAVITGGGAMMPGLVELAEQVFDMPVKVGVPTGFGGLTDLATSPMHATGIGLIMYGIKHPPEGKVHDLMKERTISKFLARVVQWLKEFV